MLPFFYTAQNFLSSQECGCLIELFENNRNKHKIWRNTIILKINDCTLFELISKEIQEKFLIEPNYFEIVKWPVGSYMTYHVDGKINKSNNFASITYLNTDYQGGETVVENIKVIPEIGKTICFEGSKYKHKVNKVENNSRYTLAVWYKIISQK